MKEKKHSTQRCTCYWLWSWNEADTVHFS